ncbi:MAG: alpha/beta hydrolase [Phyllobacteriaceae bacterium]|nr:alpha/beta hydrolase [Phyllobacteriaceae bacterium]
MMKFYKALSAESPPESAHWPLDEQRAGWNAVCAKFRAPMPDGVAVEDRVLSGVPCQIFRPAGEGLKPGLIYFHGGGWVLGGPQTHGDMCAEMAAGAGCVVVLVDYRLAPENRHPAQLEDSLAVLKWLRDHGRDIGMDPDNIIGGGDSAGGQMSAGLAMWLRDHGEKQLSGMVAIYPVFGNDTNTASALRNAEAPCLTRDEMIYFIDAFLGPKGGSNWSDPYAAPLIGDLTGLPPAFITVAAHDPLYDDGVAFHAKMLAAGNRSELREEPALAHSYMRARNHSAPAKAGFKAIVEAIRRFTRS